MKEQIQRSIQFGKKCCLFNQQEELLEVTDPLTCLWSDQLTSADNPSKEVIIFQIQKALCVMVSTFYNMKSMNVER